MNVSSEQGIRLELPKVKPPSQLFLRRAMSVILVLIMITGGLWIWLSFGLVDSTTAMVDGRAYTITPRMTDIVAQVLVRPGQKVDAGQPLVRLRGLAYRSELAEAQQKVRAVRPPSPPSLEETAERVARAQAVEASMVQRIAMARSEETNRRRLIEDVVSEHVKAQLAVRGMNAQGTPKNSATYVRAVQAEATARARMETARNDADEASRVRVAVEGELQRVRREMEAYRAQYAAVARQSGNGAGATGETGGHIPANSVASAGMGALGDTAASAPQVEDVTLLTAPVAGRVVLVQATAGQRVERGQAVVQLVSDNPAELWIVASFTEKDAVRIKPGQVCTIRLDAYAEQDLPGEVESVMPLSADIMHLLQGDVTTQSPPDSGAAKPAATKSAQENRVTIPVRVRLSPSETEKMPDIFLGMGAKVHIQTRPLPTFLARWL